MRTKAKTNDGLWVCGDLICEKGVHYIRPQNSGIIVEDKIGKVLLYKVQPGTICKGIKISNHRLYENDIVLHDDAVGVIRHGVYDMKYYGFYIEWQGAAYRYRQDILYWINDIEIIGNTIDNPEMLKEGAYACNN